MREKHSKNKKKNRKNSTKIGTKILLIFFTTTFVISTIVVIHWLKSNYDLSKIEQKVINEVVTVREENNKEQGSIQVNFENLESINKDIKAWIYIKNTNINYPILQAEDNEYYLKHDIYKNYNSCGSIFLDCNSKSDFSDDNTIVYGHNLKNQKMFTDLNKIYKGDFGNNIEIEIYSKEKFYKYQVMTAYMEKPNLDIIRRNFSVEDKNKYVNSNIEKSKIKFEYSYNSFNKLLTLVTCNPTGKDRVIVTACAI